METIDRNSTAYIPSETRTERSLRDQIEKLRAELEESTYAKNVLCVVRKLQDAIDSLESLTLVDTRRINAEEHEGFLEETILGLKGVLVSIIRKSNPDV